MGFNSAFKGLTREKNWWQFRLILNEGQAVLHNFLGNPHTMLSIQLTVVST